MTTTMSYSEIRQKLKYAFDSVCDSRTPLRIARRNGEHVVVLSESEYDALEETAYLLLSLQQMRRKYLPPLRPKEKTCPHIKI